MLNLTSPEGAYTFGFIQADGHLSKEKNRNSGKMRIELNARDADILYKLEKIIPVKTTISTRTRDTNFKKDYSTITLSAYDLKFREFLNQNGIPYGKKHKTIEPPKIPHLQIDYYRGLIDGDGSLGLTNDNRPFVSLNTSSMTLVENYLKFLKQELNHDMVSNPNKRDSTYNIILFDEIAQSYARLLYYDGCLAMDRKIKSAEEIKNWNRTTKKRDYDVKAWTDEEDQFIQIHEIKDSMEKLNRTEQSINMRLWRLSGIK